MRSTCTHTHTHKQLQFVIVCNTLLGLNWQCSVCYSALAQRCALQNVLENELIRYRVCAHKHQHPFAHTHTHTRTHAHTLNTRKLRSLCAGGCALLLSVPHSHSRINTTATPTTTTTTFAVYSVRVCTPHTHTHTAAAEMRRRGPHTNVGAGAGAGWRCWRLVWPLSGGLHGNAVCCVRVRVLCARVFECARVCGSSTTSSSF